VTEDETLPEHPENDLASRFPTAYTILFGLIILVAALTWIIPAGQYERAMNDEVGREVAVPGTYETVEPNPQALLMSCWHQRRASTIPTVTLPMPLM